MDGLTFDFTKVLVKDYPGRKSLRVSDAVPALAQVVTECPADWGDPALVKTWQTMPMRQLGTVYGEYNTQTAALAQVAPAGWSFDLSALSPLDYDLLQGIVTGSELDAVNQAISLLTRYVVGAPVDAYAKAETYQELPYYTVFVPLLAKLSVEAAKEINNFLAAAVPAPTVSG